MKQRKEKLFFLLEDIQGNKIYERELEILKFYYGILNNKDISFYYHFKDSAMKIEEEIIPKLIHKINGKVVNPIVFKVNYGENNIFSYEIDNEKLTIEDFEINGAKLFVSFEVVVERFIKEIAKIHQEIILQN